MPIQPIGHDALFLLLLQLGLLLAAARVGGELAKRLALPTVVGELLGGIALGPAVLGALAPELRDSIFPASQQLSDLLSVVTWLGVIFLLLSTGLETDLALVRRQGSKAVSVSLGGIGVTFASGIGLGYMLPESMVGTQGGRLVFVLFVATAMSISAIPVIARVLMEMKIIRRDIGQRILASGMIDDTVGWLLLSVVAGLAAQGAIDYGQVLQSIAALAVLFVFALTIGRKAVAWAVRWVDDHSTGQDGLASFIVVLVFLASALTVKLGLEAVLGAFLLGIVLREAPRFRPEASHSIEEITRLVFAPIFFASAGLKVSADVFTDSATLPWALTVLGVACIGKFIGAFLGAKAARLSNWEALAMGSGLNARGAMEIIVATIGLSLGVIAESMYSIIVMVAIVTSLMAPPLLRLFLQRVEMSPEEAERLKREESDAASFWAGVRRILLPTRGGKNVLFAAHVVRGALQGGAAEVTVVSMQPAWNWRRFWEVRRGTDVTAQAVRAATQVLTPLTTRQRIGRMGKKSVTNELRTLAREHDLVVIGSAQDARSLSPQFTFSKVTDDLLQGLSVPALVLSAPGGEAIQIDDAGALSIRKILVPTTGTLSNRVLADLGQRLAQNIGAECTYLFVNEVEDEPSEFISPTLHRAHPLTGNDLISVEHGSSLVTVTASRAGEAITSFANDNGFDLVLLGATIRPGTRRAYLGRNVEHVLHNAKCAVGVFVTQ
jgi:Kef-type K+ transport system membrane component KefB